MTTYSTLYLTAAGTIDDGPFADRVEAEQAAEAAIAKAVHWPSGRKDWVVTVTIEMMPDESMCTTCQDIVSDRRQS